MPEKKSTKEVEAFIDISIVIPFYNDEDLILPLTKRLKEVFSDNQNCEFILIDDGSGDDTFGRLSELHKDDNRFHIAGLARNCGQRRAVTEGMKIARGKVIATMDPDLQNDPAEIPALAALVGEKTALVNGVRSKREENLLKRRIPSFITNKILALITGGKMKDFGSPMAVFTVQLVRETMRLSPSGLFSKTLASMLSNEIREVPIFQAPRSAGSSSYNFLRLLKMFHFLVFSALELRLVMAGLSPSTIRAGAFGGSAMNLAGIILTFTMFDRISLLSLMLLLLTLLFLSSFMISLKNNKRLKEEETPVMRSLPPS